MMFVPIRVAAVVAAAVVVVVPAVAAAAIVAVVVVVVVVAVVVVVVVVAIVAVAIVAVAIVAVVVEVVTRVSCTISAVGARVGDNGAGGTNASCPCRRPCCPCLSALHRRCIGYCFVSVLPSDHWSHACVWP